LKKIILCPNAESDKDFLMTLSVADKLKKLGREIALCPVVFDDGRIVYPKTDIPILQLEDTLENAEMLITIGGDGTILKVARAAAEYGVPILGINMGGKGFMTELEPDEVDSLDSIIADDYSFETRMMIDICILRGGKTIYEDFALNDVVIKGDNKLIEMGVFADDRKITNFCGDGTVIATPTGSTAYSMSAGGPIVEPTAKNIIITPICAHVLEAKSFVLVASRIVTVGIVTKKLVPAYVSVDRGKHISILSGDVIKVRNSERKAKLIRPANSSFYHKISTKLASRMYGSNVGDMLN